jgi:hypothetical protein
MLFRGRGDAHAGAFEPRERYLQAEEGLRGDSSIKQLTALLPLAMSKNLDKDPVNDK